jgi:hypothetical protein
MIFVSMWMPALLERSRQDIVISNLKMSFGNSAKCHLATVQNVIWQQSKMSFGNSAKCNLTTVLTLVLDLVTEVVLTT